MEDTPELPEQQKIELPYRVWAMERVAAWIKRGTLPDDYDAVAAPTLLAMEEDGMVIVGRSADAPLVTLTPLGAYEAARLVAHAPS